MSHEVETMAYAGETPWHGLGVPVRNDLTPAQILKEAGLDWTVEREPQYIKRGGKEIATGRDVLVRSSDDKILTHVSEDWHENQNETAFEFFSEFVHTGDMAMHTAGSLKEGKMVWALAKVKESFTVFGKKDRVDSYLLFSNPHEYGKSIDIRFTPIRVVCNNTLTLSLGGKADLAVRLTHRHAFDPEMVKETMGMAHNRLEEYKSMAQFLGSKKYTPENVVEYFKNVFPKVSKKVDVDAELAKAANDTEAEIIKADADFEASLGQLSRPAKMAYDILDTQPGHEFGKGSWWQAFNATTFCTDHLLGRSPETRLNSAWYGSKRKKKIRALESAVEFAKAA